MKKKKLTRKQIKDLQSDILDFEYEEFMNLFNCYDIDKIEITNFLLFKILKSLNKILENLDDKTNNQ